MARRPSSRRSGTRADTGGVATREQGRPAITRLGEEGLYTLIGALGSPYSMKLRAVMRYRRIPHVFVMRTAAVRAEVAHVRPQIIPMLRLPGDDAWHVDTTPQIEMLERRHVDRSVIPDDPAQAFLAALIEDMADEWLTKAMFHFRWARPVDQDYGARWIIDDGAPELAGEARERAVRAIAERQIGRMALVGCTPENAPVIEASYRSVLAALNPMVNLNRHLFGSRPSVADFGLFGQLTTLATDPTPMALMRETAMRVESWVRQLDDAGGLEGDWDEGGADWSPAVVDLIRIAGAEYLPFLVANATALAAGAAEVRVEIAERDWVQAPFGYQAKCLAALRDRFAALDESARSRLAPLLGDTGCLDALV